MASKENMQASKLKAVLAQVGFFAHVAIISGGVSAATVNEFAVDFLDKEAKMQSIKLTELNAASLAEWRANCVEDRSELETITVQVGGRQRGKTLRLPRMLTPDRSLVSRLWKRAARDRGVTMERLLVDMVYGESAPSAASSSSDATPSPLAHNILAKFREASTSGAALKFGAVHMRGILFMHVTAFSSVGVDGVRWGPDALLGAMHRSLNITFGPSSRIPKPASHSPDAFKQVRPRDVMNLEATKLATLQLHSTVLYGYLRSAALYTVLADPTPVWLPVQLYSAPSVPPSSSSSSSSSSARADSSLASRAAAAASAVAPSSAPRSDDQDSHLVHMRAKGEGNATPKRRLASIDVHVARSPQKKLKRCTDGAPAGSTPASPKPTDGAQRAD